MTSNGTPLWFSPFRHGAFYNDKNAIRPAKKMATSFSQLEPKPEDAPLCVLVGMALVEFAIMGLELIMEPDAIAEETLAPAARIVIEPVIPPWQ